MQVNSALAVNNKKMAKLLTRKNNRLKEYDYSQSGYYFVTICAENREQVFGTIENNYVILNDVGNMIDQWWRKMFEKYDDISIDKYIVMEAVAKTFIFVNSV